MIPDIHLTRPVNPGERIKVGPPYRPSHLGIGARRKNHAQGQIVIQDSTKHLFHGMSKGGYLYEVGQCFACAVD